MLVSPRLLLLLDKWPTNKNIILNPRLSVVEEEEQGQVNNNCLLSPDHHWQLHSFPVTRLLPVSIGLPERQKGNPPIDSLITSLPGPSSSPADNESIRLMRIAMKWLSAYQSKERKSFNCGALSDDEVRHFWGIGQWLAGHPILIQKRDTHILHPQLESFYFRLKDLTRYVRFLFR